jgi:hypothetical protein
MTSPVVARFLDERRRPVATGCVHPPVTVAFTIQRSQGDLRFAVSFADGKGVLLADPGGEADATVVCSGAAFEDLLAGRVELLGPFGAKHVRCGVTLVPLLYAFLYAEHPYRNLNPVLPRFYSNIDFYPVITPFTQGYALYSLAVEEKLAETLEVGLAYGGSALFLCEAHRTMGHGRHTAIDPFEATYFGGEALRWVEAAGLTSVFRWIEARSDTALPALRSSGDRFDLVYLDGSHSYGDLPYEWDPSR